MLSRWCQQTIRVGNYVVVLVATCPRVDNRRYVVGSVGLKLCEHPKLNPVTRVSHSTVGQRRRRRRNGKRLHHAYGDSLSSEVPPFDRTGGLGGRAVVTIPGVFGLDW
jgi:hypothetical protein